MDNLKKHNVSKKDIDQNLARSDLIPRRSDKLKQKRELSREEEGGQETTDISKRRRKITSAKLPDAQGFVDVFVDTIKSSPNVSEQVKQKVAELQDSTKDAESSGDVQEEARHITIEDMKELPFKRCDKIAPTYLHQLTKEDLSKLSLNEKGEIETWQGPAKIEVGSFYACNPKDQTDVWPIPKTAFENEGYARFTGPFEEPNAKGPSFTGPFEFEYLAYKSAFKRKAVKIDHTFTIDHSQGSGGKLHGEPGDYIVCFEYPEAFKGERKSPWILKGKNFAGSAGKSPDYKWMEESPSSAEV